MQHEYRLFGNMTSVIVRALALHIRNRKHITLILLASTPTSFGSEGGQLILGVVVNYARPQPKWDRCFEEDRFTCYPIQNSHLRSHTRNTPSAGLAGPPVVFTRPGNDFTGHTKKEGILHTLTIYLLYLLDTISIFSFPFFFFTKRKYTDYALQFVF